ncbi:hypothetical protein KY284_009172 [Solanum tuberosum]|nr:hypothetical protein KY284_009172 [Solanum tuberosum]
MQTMVIVASSPEEQLTNLTKLVEGLTKHVQHQESRIDKLMDRMEGLLDGEVSHAPGKDVEVQAIGDPAKKAPLVNEMPVSSEGMIPLNRLKEFIEGTIKDKYEVSTKSSHMYAKPYTARIDHFKMPASYNLPNFNNLRFVRSIKGNAFDWYIDLEPNSINSWEQLEHEFPDHFYSTRRTLIDLPEMKRPDEAGKVDDPNYCKYHRLVSHSLEKCFIFKDRMMRLVNEKKIVLDDEKASSNQFSITFGSLDPAQIYISEKYEEESLEQEVDIEGKMVKKLEKQKSIKRPKRTKVEVHHYQKPRHPVTLEEFLPSSFDIKSTKENVKAWVHENKIVSSSYYQCLKYLEGGIESNVVADDNLFTEVETHFADAKFYLKGYVVKGTKSNDVKSIKSDKITSNRIDVAFRKVKVDTKEFCPILNKGKITSSNKKITSGLCYVTKVKKQEGQSYNLQENVFRRQTPPIRWIDAINLSSKLPGKSTSQNQVRDVALPTKRTRKGFDPNAYKLLVKAGYNSNEPSTLGKLPSEDTTRQNSSSIFI